MNKPHAAIEKILQQFDITVEHSAKSMEEAERWLESPGLNDTTLTDLTGLPFVTIDNEDSKDLDQALLIEAVDANSYRVRYALSDAAYYVAPGTALFKDAVARGVTYYTPSFAIPMLPRALSEGLVSLNAGEERRALVFDMLLDETGFVLKTDIVRAKIKSQAKLSYKGVQTFLDNISDTISGEHVKSTQAVNGSSIGSTNYAQSMQLLKELGEILIQRALDRDVIPFSRSEAEIRIKDEGFQLFERERVRTEKYNEQISLLCNMQGARLMEKLSLDNEQLQAIFRAHDAPLAGRIAALKKLINSFAEKNGLSEQWRWQKGQSLAEFVESLPKDADSRSKVLALERQILVCNQASEYRSEPGRHHALAANSYARFSSPMREIVGIFTHKELLEALNLTPSIIGKSTQSNEEDQALRERIIEVANTSRQTQKQISKAIQFLAIRSVLDSDLQLDPPPRHSGIIMGLRRDRIYVACDSMAVDLKVTVNDLRAQYNADYSLSDIAAIPSTSAAPEWQLGDEVSVQVKGFDDSKNRYQLMMWSNT